MIELSTQTRTLLESARAEAPSFAARAKIWSGVSAASGLAAGVGAATAGYSVGGSTAPAVGVAGMAAGSVGGVVSAAKLLATGALLGSAVTIGLALSAMYVRPAALPIEAQTQIAAAVATATPAAPAVTATTTPATPMATTTAIEIPANATTAAAAATTTATATVATAASARPPARLVVAVPPASTEDSLMREASLVAEARSALARGDAAAALRAVRAARQLPSHLLEPEELSLEAQALRALGLAAEATAVDGTLKGKYPDHALAR